MPTVTVDMILAEKTKPVVAIDDNGIITYVNSAFEQAYGWHSEDVVGKVVTAIMPPHMRDAHNFGFSRFLVTHAPRILSKPLQLPVYCKNGEVIDAEHFIVGENSKGKWRFAATITKNSGV